jgi:hypothetical protein
MSASCSWYDRFSEVVAWRLLHGHCRIPKAEGALGRCADEAAPRRSPTSKRSVRQSPVSHSRISFALRSTGRWVARQRELKKAVKLE